MTVETNAQRVRERKGDTAVKKERKINFLAMAVIAATLFAIIAVFLGAYIANIHWEVSMEKAIADLQLATYAGTFDWESTLQDAPWAIVNCPSGDFVVNSSRAFPSSHIQNCAYRVASDIRLEAIGNIWSRNGRVRFYVPATE